MAIGDLHGDLAATRRVLRLAGLMDDQDRWVGAKTMVVQTGDQLDRGNDEPEILALLDRLGREAERAGGAVHVLNGNHEFFGVRGDMRYVTPEGFADFANLGGARADSADFATFPPEERGRRAAFAPGGPFARKLARRNVVMIVGDTLFAHAGVLPHVAVYGLERLNAEASAWLRGDAPEPEILWPRIGPVWMRHYSKDPDERDCTLAARALRMTGTRRMVVGHTVQEEGISPACSGLVWCIDVGMSTHYGGAPEALEIIGDSLRAITEDGEVGNEAGPPAAPTGVATPAPPSRNGPAGAHGSA